MNIFESLENLNVSEECFEDIISIVEEILNETKKANKIAHQEAIFKKLNPHGAQILLFPTSYRPLSQKQKEAKKRMTDVSKDDFGTYGTTHSLQDYRTLEDTDRKGNVRHYDGDLGHYTGGYDENGIRKLLGRDKEFAGNVSEEPSKVHTAAQKYLKFKKSLGSGKPWYSTMRLDHYTSALKDAKEQFKK